MQTSTEPQPASPAPAAPPSPVSVTVPGADGKPQTLAIPKTSAEVQDLVAHRRELSGQLSSVTASRDQLSNAIRSAPEGASRTGLEDRIRVLDQRIIQLETDIAATGRQLSMAPAELVAESENWNQAQGGGDQFEEGVMAGGFSALTFFAVVTGYRRFRRKRRAPAPSAQMASDSAQRLERVERGVEAIAIEIERVAEGQRFVTRLLSESHTPLAAAHRIAQPVAVERGGPAKREV
jgi:hypothetical protein